MVRKVGGRSLKKFRGGDLMGEELSRIFDAHPFLDRYKVLDKALRVVARIIVKKAKENTPRGKEEDRRKRSKKQRAEANWEKQLWKTITFKLVKYENGSLVIIGPKWPDGNKAHFLRSKDGRRVFYWGRDAGKIAPPHEDWLKRSFQEVLATVKKTLIDEVRKEIDSGIRQEVKRG